MAARTRGQSCAARAVVNFTPAAHRAARGDRSGHRSAHLTRGTALRGSGARAPEHRARCPPDPRQPRLALLNACLRAQRTNLIERFPPYLELAELGQVLGTPERIAYASDEYLHDLAVWYHLAWLGETVRRHSPLAHALELRGRGFSADERRELLTLIGTLVRDVIPRYRQLAARGFSASCR